MGGAVDSRFDMQPITEYYLNTKLGEDDSFWTKLYAKLMKEFEIERCSQYPNAKAMLMLMGIIKPTEGTRLMVKHLHSKVGCFVDESSKVKVVGNTGHFEQDELSGYVRGGKQNSMIFITDLDCTTKASTSKKITTIGLGLQNDITMLSNISDRGQLALGHHQDPGECARHFWRQVAIKAMVSAGPPSTSGCV